MGPSGSLARFFQSSQLTPLLALLLLLAGVFVVLITPKEEEPQINVTMANVFIPFPGASAHEVENLVTTPAEQVLSQITGIDHVYSVTQPGMAVLTVQFKVGEDRIAALVRLHDAVAANRDWVSPYLGVGEPIIKPKGIDDVPIVTFTLWTADEERGAFELQQVAHSVEIELKRVAGTKEVYRIGGPERAIRVLMDPERLNAHGISAQDLRNALQRANASQPTGKLYKENREILVQTGTYLASGNEVKELVVGVREGRPVFIADVAEVVDGPDHPNRYAWFGTGMAYEGKLKGEFPAVTLAVSKKAGENASTVASRVIARMRQIQGTVIPDGVNVSVTRDDGATANDKAMKLMGMLLSLAIAFIVTPWLALKLLAAIKPHASAPQSTRLDRWFAHLLTPFLNGKQGRRPRVLLASGIALMLVLSLALPMVKWVVLKMLPFDNKSEFQIVVDMPTGTPLEQTAAVLRDIGRFVKTLTEVTNYQAYAGVSSPINFNGLVRQYYLRADGNQGDMQVNLVDKHLRQRKSHEIANAVRAPIEVVARAHGANIKVVEVPPGPPVLSPIVAEVYGPDYAGQVRVAGTIRAALAQTRDIVSLDDSVDQPSPKWLLKILQDKAALSGVSARDVVETMRMGLAGLDVTAIHGGSAKYQLPVRLGLPPARQSGLDDFLKLNVRAADAHLVPLSELVQVTPTERDLTIHHKDLLPVVYVVADVAGGLDSPLYGMFSVRGKLTDRPLAEGGRLAEYFVEQPADPYAGYAFKWDGEWPITYETFRDMGIAYAAGLILIYLLVVAQFRSYVTPLIIMAPIPLTIVGVLPGHALLGSQFTATSMIGMIALAGIIVRNSILLVDFVNLELTRGTPLQQAVIAAAAARAKPIILTGGAAMLGAFFILDDPIFNGLAISLIFGIFVSTLLTLVVIPVLYYVERSRLAARVVPALAGATAPS